MLKLRIPLFNEAGDGGGSGGGAGAAGAGGAAAAGAAAASGAPASGDQAAGAATTQGVDWINPDLTFAEGWQEKLPADKFGDYKATLANFKDLPSLAKSLKDSMSAARAKTEGMVKLPTAPPADAKPEQVEAYKAEMAAFRKALGVPEKPEEYDLKAPEKLPDGVQWNDEHAKQFATIAHELNLTPAQVAKLSEFQMGLTAAAHQKQVADLANYDKEQDAIIMKAFGDQADRRMLQAKQSMMTLFGKPELPVDRAELTIGLAKLADLVSEDKLVSAGQTANKLGPEAMAKEIMSDPNSPYNNPSHPRHAEQRAYVTALYQRAYPEK